MLYSISGYGLSPVWIGFSFGRYRQRRWQPRAGGVQISVPALFPEDWNELVDAKSADACDGKQDNHREFIRPEVSAR